MDNDQARTLLTKQLEWISQLKRNEPWSQEYKSWRSITEQILAKIFGKDSSLLARFKNIEGLVALSASPNAGKYYLEDLEESAALIKSAMTELERADLIPRGVPVENTKSERMIFFSHSSQDKEIIKVIKDIFEETGIKTYFAREEIAGKNPVEKIVEALRKSRGLFALLTFSVTGSQETRDWISFEIGAATAFGKTVLAWKDKNLNKESLPKVLQYLTDYRDFEQYPTSNILELAKEMRKAARELMK